MAFITAAELAQLCPGIQTDEDTEQALEIASLVIDAITGGKIGDNLDGFSEEVTKRIKRATAEQYRAILLSGGPDALTGVQPGSVSLGRFSYSTGSGASETAGQDASGLPVSQLARILLSTTGLLYTGMDVAR